MSHPRDKSSPVPVPPEPPGEAAPRHPESWFGELTRALGWNPLVGVDPGPYLESCARVADSWAAANRVALGAALAVAECQFRVLRETMEESAAAGASLLRAEDPEEAIADQAWRAVHGFERLLENLRELSATVARSQTEIAETMNRRMAEMAEEVERHLLRLRQ